MQDPQNRNAELECAERLWRERLEQLPDWIWEVDTNLVVHYSNPGSERVLGFTVSEMVGSCVLDYAPDEVEIAKIRDVSERAKTDSSALSNLIFRHKDGTVRTVHTNAGHMTDAEGRVVGYRGVTRDVTEQEAAKEIVTTLLANYKAVTDYSPIGVFIQQDEKAVYANAKMLELVGYEWEDRERVAIWDIIHPDDTERIKIYYAQRMRGEPSPETYEVRVFARSGELRHFEIKATTVTYSGAPAVLGNVIDITDRHRAEEAIRESEEKHRALVEEINDWVWEVDENAVYIYASPRVRNLLGYEPEEIVGKTPFDLMPPEEARDVSAQYGSVTKRREPLELIDNILLHKDGHEVIVQTSGTPVFDNEGHFRGYRGVDRDVTELVLADEALRYRLEFEQIITSISTRLIGIRPEETDQAIDYALEAVGRFTEVDRSFVTLVRPDRMFTDVTHEWCADGVASTIGNYQALPIDEQRWIVDRLSSGQVVYLPNISSLPQEARAPRNIMQAGGTKALLLVPMVWQGRMAGFLGLDALHEKTWSEDAIVLLRIVGEMLVGAMMRERSEEALRDSENRYRSLVETMTEGLGLTDADYHLTYVNPRLPQMLGYTADAMIGRPLEDFVDEPYREHLRFQMAERKAGRYDSYELSWRTRDGGILHTLILPQPLFDSDGAFAGTFATVTDITDRVRHEERLSKMNDCLLGFSSDPLANISDLTDLAGDLLNADFAVYHRLEEGKLHAWGAWHVPPGFQMVRAAEGHVCDDIIRSGAKETVVIRDFQQTDYVVTDPEVADYGLQTFAGRPVEFDGAKVGVLSCLFTKDIELSEQDKDVLEIIASAIVVEERRRAAETALRESEERYRRLVDMSPDAITVSVDGKFVLANAAALAMNNATAPEQMVGMPVTDVIAPAYREVAAERMRMLATGSIMWLPPTEEKFIRLDGTEFDGEISATRILYRGKPAVLSVLRDITERKRAEEHKRALERQLESQKRYFYRETILSVTDGKLRICDPPELRPYISRAMLRFHVRSAEQVAEARHLARGFLSEQGLEPERIDSFIIGVGEAITNAIKHARGGRLYAGVADDGSLWVGMADRGGGISSLILPRATLLRGFSTKPSLGLGYTIMLEVADSVMLKTGETGTTVILIQRNRPCSVDVTPAMIPDTWEHQMAT